jgi:hypothetical protein
MKKFPKSTHFSHFTDLARPVQNFLHGFGSTGANIQGVEK